MTPQTRGHSFWWWAGALVAINFLVIAAIVLRGDQRVDAPVAISPAPGALNVSTRPILHLSYARAIDATSAERSLSLQPATAGEIQTSGADVTFIPKRPLLPDTWYTLTVLPSLRQTNGEVTRYTERLAFETRPSRLLIDRRLGDRASIWAAEPKSGKSWEVTPLNQPVALGVPSPNGDQLAYVVTSGGSRWQLWDAPIDGGPAREIAHSDHGVLVNLAWAPAGDLIAYEASDVFGASISNPRIWLVRSDGSETSLLYGRGDETGSLPAWSPDGQRLVFYENRYNALVVFNFTRTLLRIPADHRSRVSWSPDSQAIVFADRAGITGGRSALKVARFQPSGPAVTALTDGKSIDLQPSWSPAGSWIAFVRTEAEADGRTGVWIMHPDGTDAHAVLTGLPHQPWLYTTPSWAPDGSALVVSREPIGPATPPRRAETWLVPLTGSPQLLSVSGSVTNWIP
jgi:Tol biopolymer transport system component